MRQAAVRTRDLRLDNRPDPFFSYRFDERPVIALLLFCIVDRELATLVYRKLQSAILASNMPSEPGSERAFLPCSCALETEMYPTDTYRNDNGSLAASRKSRPPKAASASGGCFWGPGSRQMSGPRHPHGQILRPRRKSAPASWLNRYRRRRSIVECGMRSAGVVLDSCRSRSAPP
jgi:hypothetical protein